MHILSCGHGAESIKDQYPITLGEYTLDYEGYKPCVTFAMYCKDCYDKAVSDPEVIVLYTYDDEMNYLLYPEKYEQRSDVNLGT